MRIIAIKKLKDFWEKGYSDSEQPLKVWYQIFKVGNFQNPHEIKQLFPNVSLIGNNRLIFNIAGNKYRLVVHIRYDIQVIFVRFIGTHIEYNKIDVREV